MADSGSTKQIAGKETTSRRVERLKREENPWKSFDDVRSFTREGRVNLLPIFLKLDGRQCLLVGAGNVALTKIGSLLSTGLQLRVVAPAALPEIGQLAAEGRLEWIQRSFIPADLDGNFLVVAATDSSEVNAEIHHGAKERNILSNSVDDIPNCDFFFGSVVSRGPLQVAISTAGESPAFAQRLRREIDEQLPADLGGWLEGLGQLRREILATHPSGEPRRLLLYQLAQRPVSACEGSPSLLAVRIDEERNSDFTTDIHGGSSAFNRPLLPNVNEDANASPKTVHLVGAGPGDPDLLTVKALRLIQTADVILHDDLVSQVILSLASPASEVIHVGKRCGTKSITQDEINELMIEHARRGRTVVRLKGGDPLLFGRAAEELVALANAEVPFQIVPGITAAFAAAAALGCSLTDRHGAASVVLTTGHRAPHNIKQPQTKDDPPRSRIDDSTRVIYMPGRDLRVLAQEWIEQGDSPELPCAVISHAALPDQKVQCATLASLGDIEPIAAPSLLIVGWAIARPG
jgi:uroporphyrin-III C-methyltransferase/precorrin-2 dehydrogenase/sirohydrochlorin ferrochelatase